MAGAEAAGRAGSATGTGAAVGNGDGRAKLVDDAHAPEPTKASAAPASPIRRARSRISHVYRRAAGGPPVRVRALVGAVAPMPMGAVPLTI